MHQEKAIPPRAESKKASGIPVPVTFAIPASACCVNATLRFAPAFLATGYPWGHFPTVRLKLPLSQVAGTKRQPPRLQLFYLILRARMRKRQRESE
jgi:hypothetical protein